MRCLTLSIFDIDRIVNGTPQKRLLNGYEKMKENYTESSAQEFLSTYNNEPLSFLLENSRMIFSEPFYGCAHYKNALMNNGCCNFTALESEYEKVQNYLEENGSNMNESQKSMYEDLESTLKTLLEHTKNTRIYASYIKENIDDRFEEKLSNMVYEFVKGDLNVTDMIQFVESVESPIVFFTYAPYIMDMTRSTSLNDKVNEFCEKASVPDSYDEIQWKTFVETVVCGNKLSMDKAYCESVNHIYNRDVRFIFEYYMNTSLERKLNELVEEHVKDENIVFATEKSAVNNIFFDMMESTLDAEENDAFKKQIDTYKAIAYEATLDILVSEYQQSDDIDETASGYTILTNCLSLEKAFDTVNTLYSEFAKYTTESEDDEVSDDDLDVMDREIGGQVEGKKPQAPKPKNHLNKVQFNAMDREAKWQQKKANRQQKGQELKNAAKAVTSIPADVLKSIQDQVHSLDEKDDDRRKRYMTEPGFRKKAFRNLKLAIIYGTAANVNLALVPTVAVCRHWSKKKSMRIRNELTRELQTDIRVCEEKIADANAEGNRDEKYRLMRIKDQLETELIRVKTNSKYI